MDNTHVEAEPAPTIKTRRVMLTDREGSPLAELNIPGWFKAPEILVAGTRTFILPLDHLITGEPVPGLAERLVYREAFSYVVPEPGGSPESLAARLLRCQELEQFRAEVMDPLMQPSPHGTILVHIVNALGGESFAKSAGAVYRKQMNRE